MEEGEEYNDDDGMTWDMALTSAGDIHLGEMKVSHRGGHVSQKKQLAARNLANRMCKRALNTYAKKKDIPTGNWFRYRAERKIPSVYFLDMLICMGEDLERKVQASVSAYLAFAALVTSINLKNDVDLPAHPQSYGTITLRLRPSKRKNSPWLEILEGENLRTEAWKHQIDMAFAKYHPIEHIVRERTTPCEHKGEMNIMDVLKLLEEEEIEQGWKDLEVL